MSRAAVDPVTIAEFDAFTHAQLDSGRWELVDGHILAMTNPNEDYSQSAYPIGAAQRDAARRQGCRVNIGGPRVQASADAMERWPPIPDITVRCGERVTRHWITDPVIVVGVPSPSTMDCDRGAKLRPLQAIAIHARRRVGVSGRGPRGTLRRDGADWTMAPLTRAADTLTFAGLTASMNLAEIHAGTGLAA